ncbi:MAG: cysteine synthase family protein [Chloroflexota bacterium]|nr:cysteine synthase family protein [Chloroflexota bacterium]
MADLSLPFPSREGGRGVGISPSILDAIGWTPLVALDRLGEGLPGRVVVKIEAANPGASIKDRAAMQCIAEAERDGRLKPGGVVVELTSGNMGAGLAIVCAIKGYRFIAVMSVGNSRERVQMLRALGAEVDLVPQMPGGVPGQVSGADLALVEERTRALVSTLGAYRPDQFNNPANLRAHALTTGPEIWAQTVGAVTHFCAIVGTGGTFLGTARALKARNPAVRCYAVEPEGSQVIAGMPVTDPRHTLQGAGYAAVPPQWDAALCDGTLAVGDAEALATARLLATREGIFAGFSTGANVFAALRLARDAPAGSIIATVACDSGLKYLSTNLVPE